MLTQGKLFSIDYDAQDVKVFGEMLPFTLTLAATDTLSTNHRYDRIQQIMNQVFHCLELQPPMIEADLHTLEHLQTNSNSLAR